MKFRGRNILALSTGAFTLLCPFLSSAHEVYVLPDLVIARDTVSPPFDMFAIIQANLHQFLLWTLIGVVMIAVVFFISRLRSFERAVDPFFEKLRPYAPFVARVTVGISFLAAAYFQASYGPELPLTSTYGTLTPVITVLLVLIGLMTVLGFYARLAAVIALIMYGVAWYFHGSYMLMYVNYLGEILVLLALGAHNYSLDRLIAKRPQRSREPRPERIRHFLHKIQVWLMPRSFAVLRICFGISLIAASIYAKVLHNNLGLDTVIRFHLDTLLGFEPHFLVVGAAIVEIVIGLFIMLGLELRFISIFFEFWLMQSLFFFGEAVWPHIILIGIPIAFIMYGYDEYSLEGFWFRKKKYEPVL